MSPKFFLAVALCGSLVGCGSAADEEHFDVSTIKNSHVDKPFHFVVPAEKSIQVIQHGWGISVGDYAEIKSFDVSETHGKWQIFLSHNVWSNPPGPSDYLDRQRSISAILAALSQTKIQNNLDVDINFIQVDKIPALGAMSDAKNTKNMSISPSADVGCGRFWVDCADRYIISPFTRYSEDGFMTQMDWLMPILKPKFDDIEQNGRASKYWMHRDSGVMDNKDPYWDSIFLTAFIVNPDGEVVDALAWMALGEGVTPEGLIKRFIVAADLDPDEIVIPTPAQNTGFKRAGYMDVDAAHTTYGGNFIQNAVDVLQGIAQ